MKTLITLLWTLSGPAWAGGEEHWIFRYGREAEITRQAFTKLLGVSEAAARADKVELDLADGEWLQLAYFAGGCLENPTHENNLREPVFHAPYIRITAGNLRLDQDREPPTLILGSLAHETAHLERYFTEPPMDCLRRKELYAAGTKEEELRADRRGVELLCAAGYDGPAIMRDWLPRLLQANAGRPAYADTHPLIAERQAQLDAIRSCPPGR